MLILQNNKLKYAVVVMIRCSQTYMTVIASLIAVHGYAAEGPLHQLPTATDVRLHAPARAPIRLLQRHETVFHAPGGMFIESMAAVPDRSILITNLFKGEIWQVRADGTAKLVNRIAMQQGAPGLIAVVRASDGTLYATLNDGKHVGIWRRGSDGIAGLWATLPAVAQPNGLAFDGQGGLIIGDNVAGLWRARLNDATVSRWLLHTDLTRRQVHGLLPAANGVQLHDGYIYVSNSDRGLLLRIAVNINGSAGALTRVADGVPGDDFAIDTDGTAYVTTHPYNSVIAVAPNGARHVVVDRSTGAIGPTSAIIVDGWLYVANDGGAFAGLPTADQRPGVIRYRLAR